MGVFYRAGEFIGGISKELADKIGKVVQTPSDLNDEFYELLFSKTADNTERTEETRKCSTLQYNPNQSAITIGSRAANSDIGTHSIAMGFICTASDICAHAEGVQTIASGAYSHSENCFTTASGIMSHSEGFNTTASGQGSHAEGDSTIANHRSQHVFGEFNIEDPSQKYGEEQGNYIEIVGNGTTNIMRSNARTLDWNGNEMLAGSLSLAGASSDISLTGADNTWDGTNTSLKSALADKSSTSHNHDSTYLKLSGGTMTGQITAKAGKTSWIGGRNGAGIINTAYDTGGSWFPLFSIKASDGTWDVGTLSNSTSLFFSFATDTNFNNNTNKTAKYQLIPNTDNADHSCIIAHSGNVGTGDSNGQVKIAGTNVSVKGWTNFLPLAGGTMTGGITCATSGANLKWGNITIYGGGSNGGINSMLVGDDVTIGDCNISGCFGMKSTGSNAGFRFYNSNGGLIGGLQSTNGTLQWFNSSGTAYNIAHAGNVGTGDSNGQVKIAGTNVSVKGLQTTAYTSMAKSATANTVVQRDASGYIYGTYLNTTCGEANPASYTNPRPLFVSSDNWIRRSSAANFRTLLGLGTMATRNTTDFCKVARQGWGTSVTFTPDNWAQPFLIVANSTAIVICTNGNLTSTHNLNGRSLNKDIYKTSSGTGTVSISWSTSETGLSSTISVSMTNKGVYTVTLGSTGQITVFYY